MVIAAVVAQDEDESEMNLAEVVMKRQDPIEDGITMGKVVIAAVVAQAASPEVAETQGRVVGTRKVIACAFCLQS